MSIQRYRMEHDQVGALMMSYEYGEYVTYDDHLADRADLAAKLSAAERREWELRMALEDIATADRFAVDMGAAVFTNYLQHRAQAALTSADWRGEGK